MRAALKAGCLLFAALSFSVVLAKPADAATAQPAAPLKVLR
jgi:hypothetical protein